MIVLGWFHRDEAAVWTIVLRGIAQSADHSSLTRTSKVAAKPTSTNNGRQLQLYIIP